MRNILYKISKIFSKINLFLLLFFVIIVYNYFKSSHINVKLVQENSQSLNSFNIKSHENENESTEKSSEFDEIPLQNRIINLNSITIDVLKPKNKRNIFFVFDSITDSKRQKKLNFRDICSIESAVLKHPDHVIFITFLTIDDNVELRITKPFYGLAYKNIRFGKLNILEFSRGTPWEHFYKQEVPRNFNDISKFGRLLLLWKYGGIAVDNEMIVRKSLKDLKNFVCSDEDGLVAYNVMEFEEKNVVEIFINNTLKDFGVDSSGFLRQAVEKLCKNSKIDNDRKNCNGFKVMSREFCYPISRNMQSQLFEEGLKSNVMKLVKNSAVIHMWNSESKDKKVDKSKSTAASEIMMENCPKTYGVVWKNEF